MTYRRELTIAEKMTIEGIARDAGIAPILALVYAINAGQDLMAQRERERKERMRIVADWTSVDTVCDDD